MKKIILLAAVFVAAGFGFTSNAQTYTKVNIVNQPGWGPVGYDYVRYYYLPELNVYYDVTRELFIYKSRREWITARTLPSNFGRVDLYRTYKVVVNRNTPYKTNSRDVAAYGKYKNERAQASIRDSRDSKYYQSRQHPKHNEWEKSQVNKNSKGTNHIAPKNTRNRQSANNGQRY
ncbi:MAG: hypothetical protein QM727_10695 [Niabella sp.]